MLTRSRTDVDHPVRGPDRLLVVLHDENGVAQVAQPGQRGDELGVVALVQPDGRLVEDVEDAHQRGPDLGREADPLGLAAGQRHAGPIHGQVIEPDVDEEPETRHDLLDHLVGDRTFPLAQGRPETGRPAQRVLDGQRRDVPDVPVADRDGEDLWPQPFARALGARLGDHELLDLGLDVVRVRFAVAPLEVGDDAFEVGLVGALATLVLVAHEHALLVALRIQEVVQRLLGQLADGQLVVPAVRGADGLDDLEPPRGVRGQQAADAERTLAQALGRIGDEQCRVDLELGTEARAGGTRAVRRVEREVAGFQLFHREPVDGTAVLLAVAAFVERRRFVLPWGGRDQHDALAEAQRRLDGVGKPRGVGIGHDLAAVRVDRPAVGGPRRAVGRFGVAHDVAVDHDLDGVALVLVELGWRVGDVVHLAIHPDADVALAPGGFDDPVALRLAVLDERPQDEQPGPFGQRQDLVDDLLDALALDGVAGRAMRDTDTREQQSEMVVDLRDRPDRGARVPRCALLIDGDGRREPVDLVDVRLLHLAQELAGVRRQALDVAALALGVDGVEGEAGLAGAAQAGDDDEPVAREGDRDVLEVVLARAAHDELILGHAHSLADPTTLEQAFTVGNEIPGRDDLSRGGWPCW